MKFRDRLTNADIDMTMHARQHGKALLKIWYYSDRKGVVRKVIEVFPLKTDEFYDKGLDED